MRPQDKKNKLPWNEEEKRRIVGFFDLLIKVDKRTNPHLYQNKKLKNSSRKETKRNESR